MEQNNFKYLRRWEGRPGDQGLQRLRLYPLTELKCVWMVAGVLTYRLCNRSHDCESCPLDRALQAGPARA